MKKILEGLNPEQCEVVRHDRGPLLVGAVAGSGKTQALIRRIGYLVSIRGVDPDRILAVTFSKGGADEMQTRLDELIGNSGARIGTFHSLAYEIMRDEKPEYRTWQVDDKGKYRICIKEAVGYAGMKWEAADINILEAFISLCKGDCVRPDSDKVLELAAGVHASMPSLATDPEKLIMAYDEAEEIRKARRFICFEDMLLEAVELLQKDSVWRRWSSKYDYILQDEAQDQNFCQIQIGELLAKEHRNYMLVGDPAQTIYSFRGVIVERFIKFREQWDAKLVVMNRNYRCGSIIVKAANSLLSNMEPETSLGVEMICERDFEGIASFCGYANMDEEGYGIAQQIKIMLVDVKPQDIAILYRTNAQSRAPEEALISSGIPYRVVGSINFYERKEVKHLLSYLRLATNRGDYDDVAGSINSPFRFLGKRFLERIRDASEDRKVDDWLSLVEEVCVQEGLQRRQRQSANEWIDIISRMKTRILLPKDEGKKTIDESKPTSILSAIVRETNYLDWLRKEEGDETPDNSRVSNVSELIRAATRFKTVDDLLDYVDVTLESSKKQKRVRGVPSKVTLCSIHRSKGLEWKNVFLAGASEDIIPHSRCDDIEEERRLFYVGVTRARDTLMISGVRQIAIAGDLISTEPSRFVKEIIKGFEGDEHNEIRFKQ